MEGKRNREQKTSKTAGRKAAKDKAISLRRPVTKSKGNRGRQRNDRESGDGRERNPDQRSVSDAVANTRNVDL